MAPMVTLLQLMLAPAQLLRRSRALASMLPAFLLSGIVTLAMTAVMRLAWNGTGNDFTGAWMEAWLTSWPIAFPLTYLLAPVLHRLTLNLSAPSAPVPHRSRKDAAASAQDMAQGFSVLR